MSYELIALMMFASMMLMLLTGQPLALNRLAVHPDDADRALEALAAVETSEGEVSANES